MGNIDDKEADNMRVAYIMGYGRSGSTLLDVILNNHTDIVSVGALSNFLVWEKNGEICACRKQLSQCEFWRAVKREAFKKIDESLANLRKIQVLVESRRNFVNLLRGGIPQKVVETYSLAFSELFIGIKKVSGCRLIVDSSKSAGETIGRAYALKKIAKLDVKVLHLIRDGRGVMFSAMKKPGSHERTRSRLPKWLLALWVVTSWVITNVQTLVILRRLGDDSSLLVRYESLMAQPEKELQRIGAFIGIDMDNVIDKIRKNDILEVGHNLGGNRLRFKKSIKIEPDFEWETKLAKPYKLLFWLIAWPFARRFGYQFVW